MGNFFVLEIIVHWYLQNLMSTDKIGNVKFASVLSSMVHDAKQWVA